MAIFLKTEDEIELMRLANKLVAKTLAEISKYVKPGITTLQLDKVAEAFIRDHGAIPTFKNFPNPYGPPFPASICTSVNDVVVHGIPDDKTILRDGDIISIDCGACLNGFNGDSCYTFPVGDVPERTKAFLKKTREALYLGIKAAKVGNRIGDIGYAVQSCCESHGYGIVRELTGHGIGRKMHEEPQVPNYGSCGTGSLLKQGMCIAIEPMVTMGDKSICLMPDRWTIRTKDGSIAAHYEHTIAIRRGEPEILSSFDEIDILLN